MARKLDSYKGRLSPEQIAEGINVARRNARRLYEDAEALLHLDRLPSAVSLAILSIEESGKGPILRELALATTEEEVSKVWRDYRSHTKKNIMWLVPQLVANGARRLEEFRPLFESEAEHPHVLDQLKQVSIYTDCLGKAHWAEPSKVIDRDLAVTLARIASILLSNNEVTAEEIRLWIKHMHGIKHKTFAEQKEALFRWYAEMQELELAGSGVNLVEVLDWLGIRLDP